LVIGPDRTFTYGECLARAESVARGLALHAIDRAACIVHDADELIALLIGSSASGTELCVYSTSLGIEEVNELTTAFDHHHLITDDTRTGLDVIQIGLGDLAVQGDDVPHSQNAPILILTTGTTGRPKGARHDWARLVSGVRRREGTSRERWLLAYNLNQFAGIQVVLHALVGGSTIVVPPSNQPREALAVMRDLHVTHASATPTFWRFVVALLDGDAAAGLSLEQITLGGEAIPASLLPEIARLFPAARVSQIYASTELGSSVSVRDGLHGLPLSVLDRGDQADVQFRVVDGELHARSRVGMLGYAGEADDDGWRATGDLVEIRNGRIIFGGRASEIINVGGVKVHPLAVEEVITTVAGVAHARVFGRSNPMTGQIVAVEVVAAPGADPDLVSDAIREACGQLPAAACPRLIKFVPTLKTRDHKIVRRPDAASEPGS
jgi:acyl-coenzyme A synthetase/AMP-(fatty) acid ligase